MYTNPNMILEIHKSRERDLIRRAESSRLQKLNGPSRPLLTERFVQAFTKTFGFWGLA